MVYPAWLRARFVTAFCVALMIQDAVEAALPGMRSQAESLMVDSCTVEREDPSGTPDPMTGEPPWVQVYSGKGKRQSYSSYEQAPEAGGKQFVVQRYSAHFPIGAFKPQVGDMIEWVSCPFNPDMEGSRDRIPAKFNISMSTAMRIGVEEVVA